MARRIPLGEAGGKLGSRGCLTACHRCKQAGDVPTCADEALVHDQMFWRRAATSLTVAPSGIMLIMVDLARGGDRHAVLELDADAPCASGYTRVGSGDACRSGADQAGALAASGLARPIPCPAGCRPAGPSALSKNAQLMGDPGVEKVVAVYAEAEPSCRTENVAPAVAGF